jgi:hypothetical protein
MLSDLIKQHPFAAANADERPAVAFACLLFVLSLNPVGLVTTIAEQYGWIQPRKVQIEVKEPVTGSYRPAAVSVNGTPRF